MFKLLLHSVINNASAGTRENSMFFCRCMPTLGKTLSSSFLALHIKRLKFTSQTLVKSLFGLIAQTVSMLTVVLSHGP